MENLKVVGWTNFENDYPTRQYTQEEMNNIIQIIREEIIKNRYYFGGEDHQCSSTGVPVFSDGTCFRASMRCWGFIMSTVYLGPNKERLTYMDFYMSLGEKAILPKKEEINVKPIELEKVSLGVLAKEDSDLLSETVCAGMPLMTFDKVLTNYIELISNHR